MFNLRERMSRATLLSYNKDKNAIKEIYGEDCPVCGKKTGGGICIGCLGANADSEYVKDVEYCLVCGKPIPKGQKVKLCEEHVDLFKVPNCVKCGTPAHPYFVEKIVKSGKLFAAGTYTCKYCKEGRWKPYNTMTGLEEEEHAVAAASKKKKR